LQPTGQESSPSTGEGIRATEESDDLREILDHPLVRAEYPNLEERIRTLFPHLFLGFWNEGKLQTIQLTWSPDIVFHAPLGTDIIRGFENVKAMILGLRSAFAEGRYELEDVVIDHDRVVARITHTGTHVGDFFGLPRDRLACSLAVCRSTTTIG